MQLGNTCALGLVSYSLSKLCHTPCPQVTIHDQIAGMTCSLIGLLAQHTSTAEIALLTWQALTGSSSLQS